ncbi:MAG: HDIG domain-containing protein [Myxococcales bacterium]
MNRESGSPPSTGEEPRPGVPARPARTTSPEHAFLRRLANVPGLRSLAGAALLGAVAVSCALLLSPARLAPRIPGDEALGTIATSTIKANRDYDVLDPETTELKRDEAARSVWPVYSSDPSAGETLQQRIAAAFAVGRGALAEWQRANPNRAARILAAQEARARPGAARAKPAFEEVELLRYLSGRRDEFLKALQAVIDDDQYLAIASSGFDSAVERAAARLGRAANAGYTVGERELLAADRERGITVRPLPGADGSSGGERQVRDIDRIRDLSQVRAEVERLGQDQLGDLAPPLRRAVVQLVRRALRPNLTYDDAETRRRVEEKRAQVKDVLLQIKKGEKIIGDGEQVTKTTLLVFHAISAAGKNPGAEQIRWGGGLFAALLVLSLYVFARRNLSRFRPRGRDLLLLAAVLVGQLCLARASLAGAELVHDLARDTFGARSFAAQVAGEMAEAAVPFAAGAMLIRFLLVGEAALAFVAVAAPLCGLLAGASLQPAVLALVGGLVAADRAGRAGSRSALFRAGAWTAGANVLVVAAFALFQARFFSPEAAAAMAGAALGGALLVPLTVLLTAPVFEVAFGVTSDIDLLKLANFNHPVLKDLIVQAPGTYHHSIVIGALVEAGARAIGANALLARVGAYYHDIGKSRSPLLFGENQKGENRHDQLSPQASASLILRHVSEGLELARQAKLPRPVRDFIAQHHGTRLLSYFYVRAKEEAERTGSPPPPEADFRYPGPRPQTREAALVMIAEVVVATSRNLGEASADTLRTMIDHALTGVLAESQLDDCELTQRDLRLVRGAFVEALLGLYRARPAAPAVVPGASTPKPAALRVLTADAPGDPDRKLARKS